MLADLGTIRSWLDFRRKRFWALVLIAVYSISGFLLLPWGLARIAPELARDNLQSDLQIEKIRFNPWALRLQVDGLLLQDDEQRELLTFDTLVINLNIKSAFFIMLDFDEIRLDKPGINLVRFAFADTNWGRMLANYDAANPPVQEQPSNNDDALGLHIAKLDINNGTVNLEDAVRGDLFTTRITPINIAVNDLSTLDGVRGAEVITLTTENGMEVSWQGDLDLSPLESVGRIELSGTPLPTLYRYFEKELGFSLDHCCLEAGFDYTVEALADGTLNAAIDNAELTLNNLELSEKDTGNPLLNMPLLQITGAALRWPEQTVRVDEVLIDATELYLRLDAAGALNIDRMIMAEAEAVTAATTSDESAATENEWDVSLNSFRISNLRLGLEDGSLDSPGELLLYPVNLSVSGITTAPEAAWPVELSLGLETGGTLNFSGALTALPDLSTSGQLSVEALNLPGLQPWVQEAARLRIDSGVLNLQTEISSSPQETLALSGDFEIAGLELTDTLKQERLSGWESLQLEQLRLLLDANEVNIDGITIKQPFARINIAADGSTNFDSLTIEEESTVEESTGEKSDQPETAAEPLTVRVGKVTMDGGSTDFSDQSLPLPFRVLISDFSGSISTIDSTSSQPSQLDFAGQVGEYGLATLAGNLSVMDPSLQTAIDLDFRNLSMPALSPYSAEFVGRKIQSGKLDIDLEYTVEEGKLLGRNNIVLNDFSLGEKVASENALSLPLDLGIALLTDANGVIDLDVKVSGDMNDPDFSAAGIIIKAFANVITKAAVAPFRLLGALAPGGGGMDLEAIEFAPGSAELAPPEREKLIQVSAALAERPALTLQIDGGFNREADMAALRKQNVNNQLTTLTGDPAAGSELTGKGRKAREKLVKQQLPQLSLKQLREEYKLPDPETGKRQFDELAYTTELQSRLEAVQPIDDASLQILARQRRDMMLAYLESGGTLDPQRYTAGKAVEAELVATGWVRIPLVLNASPPPTTTAQR